LNTTAIPTLVGTQSTLVGTQSTLVGTQSTLVGTQSTLVGTQSTLVGTQSTLVGTQFFPAQAGTAEKCESLPAVRIITLVAPKHKRCRQKRLRRLFGEITC
jgi:hypothetical protein